MIAHIGVGFDNIDLQAATENGILVSNTPGVLNDTTADFAFSLLMAASRRLAEADTFVRSGQWKKWSLDMLAGMDIHHRIAHALHVQGARFVARIISALLSSGGGSRVDPFSMRNMYIESSESGVNPVFTPSTPAYEDSSWLVLYIDSVREPFAE